MKRRLVWAVLLLCGLVFSSVAGFGFLDWDDDDLLTKNAWVQIQQLTDIGRVWDPTPAMNSQVLEFFPLRDSCYALLHSLWSLTPAPFHIFNLLLHLLIVYLVWALSWRLALWRVSPKEAPYVALCAAVIFGLHPIHVEPVAWVSGLKELLMTCFVLLGCLAFLRFVEGPLPIPTDESNAEPATEHPTWGGRWGWGLLALVCVLLAAWSKHVGVFAAGFYALIGVLWGLTHPHVHKRPLEWLLRRGWPVFAGLCVGGGWGWWSLQIGKGHLQIREAATLAANGANAATSASSWFLHPWAQGMNIWRLLMPFGYQPMYAPPKAAEGLFWWGMLVLCLLVVGWVCWCVAKRSWFALFGVAWLVCGVLPFALFQVGDQWIADRYLYLPSVGFAWLVALAWMASLKWLSRRTAGVVLLVVMGVYVGGVLSYLPMWRSPTTFWAGFVKRAPTHSHALLGMASFHMAHKQPKKAIKAFLQYRRHHPPAARQMATMAVAYLLSGQPPKAIQTIRLALQRFPKHHLVLHAAGFLMVRGGQPKAAIGFLERALQQKPQFLDARMHLIRAYLAIGQRGRACFHMRVLLKRPLPIFISNEIRSLLKNC